MVIHSREQFVQWLEETCWLQDVIVEALQPLPAPASSKIRPPEQVQLSLSLQIAGGYQAGELRRIRLLHLLARGVSEYSIAYDGGFAPGNCCMGADLLDSPAELGMTLDVPAELRLRCTTIEVAQAEREETIEPWYSDREFSALVPNQPVPTPENWLEWCRSRNIDAVWRYFASDEVFTEAVPADYTGYFLQLRSRLAVNPVGLFISGIRADDAGFRLHIENHDMGEQALWKAAADYVARFPNVIVRCGNAVLSRDQWRFRPSA